MPYTIAHPAIVLPLKARWPRAFSLTGLVLGSAGPDLEFFARLRLVPGSGHDLSDLFTRTLPASLLLAPVLHRVVRPTLVAMLPAPWDRRLREWSSRPWSLLERRRLLVFVSSVAVGFFGHLVLDAFTHRHGFVVRRVAAFRAPVAGTWMPVYWVAQHALSWVLLVAQAVALHRWLRALAPGPGGSRETAARKATYWSLVVALTVLVTLAGLWRDRTAVVEVEGTLAIAPLSGMFLGMIVGGLLLR